MGSEPDSGRSSADAPGTAICVDHGARKTWHHSVAFDGTEHETACGQGIFPEAVLDVEMDLAAWDDLEDAEALETGRCDESTGSVWALVPELDGVQR